MHELLTCCVSLARRSKHMEMKARGADSAARGTPLASALSIEAEQLDANRPQANGRLYATYGHLLLLWTNRTLPSSSFLAVQNS